MRLAFCFSLLAIACSKKAEESAAPVRETESAVGWSDYEKPSSDSDARTGAAPKSGGEALFGRSCAMCHREIGMGTGLLARRTDVAKLEDRDDLTAEFVIQAARIGIGNMPAITRGEVSDAELRVIAEHLASRHD
jgi:mono/diheme cytochrome c family protein